MGASFWVDDALPHVAEDAAQRPAQPLDVLIVGAGIVGLTAATVLADRGRRVGVIDGSPIGTGVTGQSTAKVTIGTGLRIDAVNRRHGDQAAAQYLKAGQAGLDWVRDHLSPQARERAEMAPHTLYATTSEGASSLRQHKDLVDGLGVRLDVQTGNTPTDATYDVSYRDQLMIQPVDYLRGLAAALLAQDVPIWSELPVLDAHDHHVTTPSGDISAAEIVLATHVPLGWAPAALPWEQQRHYAAVVRTTRPVPMAYDVEDGWSTRPITGHPGLALALGGGHPTGADEDGTNAQLERLTSWASNVLDGELVTWWSSQDVMTSDDVPLVGRIRPGHAPHTATGFAGWGFAHGTAAGIDLAGRLTDGDAMWDFWSLTPSRLLAMVPQIGRNAVSASRSWASRQIHAHSSSEGPTQLNAGEAEVASVNGRSVARSVTSDGVLRELDATCTHMGCLVNWNPAEETWDCPCHGSRFSPDGAVLHGPATRPLQAAAVESQA
ncbi:MAG TPA: FAD-dependent oxidoreductase [Actinomycetes bacterium]|nr:FAD-dependent oxidoreductase [Actinomycetes bacterium]